MTDKQTAPQQAGELVEVENFAPQASLLDSIISQSRVARSDTERNRTTGSFDAKVSTTAICSSTRNVSRMLFG